MFLTVAIQSEGELFSEASVCLFLQISLDRVSASPLTAVSSVDFSLEPLVLVNNLAALVQSSLKKRQLAAVCFVVSFLFVSLV